MIVHIGFVLLAVSRWLHQQWRRPRYTTMIRQLYKGCSVFVRRSAVGSDQNLSRLMGSELLKASGNYKEQVMIQDDTMTVIAVRPRQTVHLGEWTSYYQTQGRYIPQGTGDDVWVLLEAQRPVNLAQFLKEQMAVAPANKIHVLSLGAAVAWHAGTPFGIILHCTLEKYISLMMGFVDGSLTMDEDLEVTSLLTVDVEGQPESFISEKNQNQNAPRSVSPSINRPLTKVRSNNSLRVKVPGYYGVNESGNDQMTDQWSNESLASGTSIGRVELLEISDTETMDSAQGDDGFMDSGSGEGLSEMDLADSTNSLSQSWGLVRMNSITKPPNLLIYTGKADSVRKFEKVKAVLEQCLNTECYVMYHLKHEDIDLTPWMENTCLLVIQCRKVYRDANEAFLQYFQKGGKVFCIGNGFDAVLIGTKSVRSDIWISEVSYKDWSNVPLIVGGSVYNVEEKILHDTEISKLGTDKDKNVTVVRVNQMSKVGSGCAILSQVLFDKDAGDLGVTPEFFNTLKKSNATRFEILRHLLTSLGLECSSVTPPTLTPAVLVTRDKTLQSEFMKSIESRLSSGVLKFGTQSLLFSKETQVETTESLLPVITPEGEPVCENFNREFYMQHLKSKVLGNTVIYTDVVPTTMTLLDGLLFSVPDNVGLIAIARQQTSGKGRGGNSWLSPIGCAMFSLHVRVPLESPLGKAVSYLQHITALAVVNSVIKQKGYQDIDLRLKWPNDIYYGSMMKLGGVIVKSTVMDGMVHATIGCGFNVSNSNPTICINDLIQLHNRQVGEDLSLCTTEQLIAGTVADIEGLIDQFQTKGCEDFKQQYYARWLHSNVKVTLQSEGNMEVDIVGLDDYGYLLVKNAQGELISVQPDGNSFDMMQNLITMKTRHNLHMANVMRYTLKPD